MDYNLIHSGILGMKWGIRRYQYKDGSLTPEGKKRYGAKYEKQALKLEAKEKQQREAEEAKVRKLQNEAAAKRDPKEMTTQELREYMERYRLETDYLKATGRYQEKGEAWYATFLKKTGQQTLNTVANKTGEAIGKKVAKALFGEEDNNKKNK